MPTLAWLWKEAPLIKPGIPALMQHSLSPSDTVVKEPLHMNAWQLVMQANTSSLLTLRVALPVMADVAPLPQRAAVAAAD